MELLSSLYIRKFGKYLGFDEEERAYVYMVGESVYKFSRNGVEKL